MGLITFPYDVSLITVNSDGTSVSGKPLVLFYDMVKAAMSIEAEIVAFTNSDIYFSMLPQMMDEIEHVKPMSAIVSSRVNVESISKSIGETYPWGYDLFVLHRSDISKICSNMNLYFGGPWWDYHAIYNLILSGVNLTCIDSAHVLHLSHEDAFEWDRWEEIGIQTINGVKKIIETKKFDRKSEMSVKLATNTRRFLRREYQCGKPLYYHLARKVLSKSPCEIDKSFLHRISHELKLFVEQVVGCGQSDPNTIALACSELQSTLEDSK